MISEEMILKKRFCVTNLRKIGRYKYVTVKVVRLTVLKSKCLYVQNVSISASCLNNVGDGCHFLAIKVHSNIPHPSCQSNGVLIDRL